MSKIGSLWEGVYSSFEEAGGDCNAFDSDIWIKKQRDRIFHSLENYKNKYFPTKDYPLPLAVSFLLSEKENISVLDFGGGMGLQFLDVVGQVPEAKNRMEYNILDSKSSIENKPKEIDQFKNLNFYQDLEQLNQSVDLIHIGSTLQYIEGWKSLLENLVKKFNPSCFVFSELMAGDIPNFVSHQIFYEKNIPHSFLNLSEFIDFFQNLTGMKNIYRSKHIRTILDQEKVYPNFNLPQKYRIDRPVNLIFK